MILGILTASSLMAFPVQKLADPFDPASFVLTEKWAYSVLPPVAVVPKDAVSVQWSSTGKYLLIGVKEPSLSPGFVRGILSGQPSPKPSESYYVWDKASGRTTKIGAIPNLYDESRRFLAIEGTDSMAAVVEAISPGIGSKESRLEVALIDLANARLKRIVPFPNEDNSFVQIFRAPKRWGLVAAQTVAGHGPERVPSISVALMNSDGRVLKRLALPNASLNGVQWHRNGDLVRFRISSRGPAGILQTTPTFDLSQGGQPVDADPGPMDGINTPEPDLEALILGVTTKTGVVETRLFTAWLRSTKPTERTEVMLQANAQKIELAPTQDAVAMIDNGVATVRQLVELPIEAYLRLKNNAERSRAVLNAKMVGTALHMYAADNNDAFPDRDQWANGDSVYPYLKNRDILNGFVYTFAGGSVSNVANPSGTMVGYIPCAGGYAVTFVDSSVRWMPELPKS